MSQGIQLPKYPRAMLTGPRFSQIFNFGLVFKVFMSISEIIVFDLVFCIIARN